MMNYKQILESDPMLAVIAKQQLDAECAEDNAAAVEDAENAHVWQTLPGHCPVVPMGYNSSGEICCWSHPYRTMVCFKKLSNSLNDVTRLAPLDQLAEWLNTTKCKAAPFPLWDDCEQAMRRKLIDMVTEYILVESARRLFRDDRVKYNGVWKGVAGGIVYNSGRRRCYRVSRAGVLDEMPRCIAGKTIYAATDGRGILPAETAMTDREGEQLTELIRLRPWQSPLAAEMVVGWMACSLLAGVLPVRPQLWINAPAGTGKSNLKEDITAALGGERGLLIKVDGRSTEAGIRRMLDKKALPLIFDEAEPDSDNRKQRGAPGRMDNILELIRTVATDDAPGITQCGFNGSVTTYCPLFCSLLFSVDHGLDRETDISRFIVLNLTNRETRAEREARYKKQEPLKAGLKDPDFTPRLLRRVLERHAEIMRNAETLKKAIKVILSGTGAATVDRTSANMALLFAGCYSVSHSGDIPAELVAEYAKQSVCLDDERNSNTDRRSDAERVLDALLTYRDRKTGKTVTRLCCIAYEHSAEPEEIDAAECALEGLGLKIVRAKDGIDRLALDTFSRGFREIFEDCSISAKSVRSALGNDPDGIAAMRCVKFVGGRPKTVPCVPMSYIRGLDDE
ncbi:MAG: hypothetical protein ACI4OX_01295 [Akkermansia sp.]